MKQLRSARLRLVLGAIAAGIMLMAMIVSTPTPLQVPHLNPDAFNLRVAGNQLVTPQGRPVMLRGVNRDGSDFQCAAGKGIFDGPAGLISIRAMLTWNINVVRVPLNESCWLGLPGLNSAMSGTAYQNGIAEYVHLLTASGLYVILDLHKSAPGDQIATKESPMPDADHSLTFWRQVAGRFKSNGMVLFDAFNEPFHVTWPCLLHGGDACQGLTYQAVGTQALVDTIRGTGAKNVILISGLFWSNDLSKWLAYEPVDPLRNLAASWHVYPNSMVCNNDTCYGGTLAPLAKRVPVVNTEIGADAFEHYCGNDQVAHTILWLDAHHIGYLAFTWNVWSQKCGGLSLISNYNGTPKAPNGTWFKDHLARFAQRAAG